MSSRLYAVDAASVRRSWRRAHVARRTAAQLVVVRTLTRQPPPSQSPSPPPPRPPSPGTARRARRETTTPIPDARRKSVPSRVGVVICDMCTCCCNLSHVFLCVLHDHLHHAQITTAPTLPCARSHDHPSFFKSSMLLGLCCSALFVGANSGASALRVRAPGSFAPRERPRPRTALLPAEETTSLVCQRPSPEGSALA